jgi:hypothetical protein
MCTRTSCQGSQTMRRRSSTDSSETSLPAKLLSKLLSNGLTEAGRPPRKGGLPIWWRVVPPRGFEPLISALKGRRPRPLDDGGGLPGEKCTTKRKGHEVDPLALTGSGSWIRTNDLRVMSPTSYHCSIPRRFVVKYSNVLRRGQGRPWHRPIVPRRCRRSIVGAGAFHDRVREGNGWGHPAGATRATAS